MAFAELLDGTAVGKTVNSLTGLKRDWRVSQGLVKGVSSPPFLVGLACNYKFPLKVYATSRHNPPPFLFLLLTSQTAFPLLAVFLPASVRPLRYLMIPWQHPSCLLSITRFFYHPPYLTVSTLQPLFGFLWLDASLCFCWFSRKSKCTWTQAFPHFSHSTATPH